MNFSFAANVVFAVPSVAKICVSLGAPVNDTVYDEMEKGMYRHPIYGEFNAGNLITDAVDSLIYFKNLLIYYGATCR